MSRIDALIAELCPEGVEFKILEELGATYGGLTGKAKADFSDGNARFISYVNIFNNLGKFGFNTGTSDINLNYVIDEIAVSTIEYIPTPPPSALVELLSEDFETGQTVGP